jgi:DNA-binding NtrC family response regulator
MSNELASILIVDDDTDLRGALANIFADCGYRVRTAADGFAALAEMNSEVPDVLISDLNMPAMSGFELLSVVRSRFPKVGVIAMSGGYSGNGVPKGVAADAFYPKGGASIWHLPEMINEIVERGRSHPRRWVD